MNPKTVLLDTSFIITLLDAKRPYHQVAKQYYAHFLSNGYTLFLSTIAIAEYCHKGAIEDLPLNRARVLPFVCNHATRTAALNFKSLTQKGVARHVAKDDIKLLAQAVEEGMGGLMVDDEPFFNTAKALKEREKLSLSCIHLNMEFDIAFVNGSGQTELPLT